MYRFLFWAIMSVALTALGIGLGAFAAVYWAGVCGAVALSNEGAFSWCKLPGND